MKPQAATKRRRVAPAALPPAESPPHPLDGATAEEFTGMRAEFTSKFWFDNHQGIRHRRLYSWYGYHGGNMSWRQMMTLITRVHFPDEEDMRLPADRQEREDRTRGVRLTNLEKCLVTKMFITTGLEFTKLADLWGCNERTISAAIRYWEPRWQQAATKYCRLRVWDGYLKACQPAGWSNRYKHPISHMTDGSVVQTNTPRKSCLSRFMYNSKIEHSAALGITLSTPTGCGFLGMPLYCGKLSEVGYMSLHQRWFDMIPPGFARLVDKGFTRTTRYYRWMNFAYVPAFIRSNSKDLSGAQLKDARKQSSDRYTCEVYFARVKGASKLLKGECRHYHWRYLETAWCLGHYNANLQPPLRLPHNFDELKSQYEALVR